MMFSDLERYLSRQTRRDLTSRDRRAKGQSHREGHAPTRAARLPEAAIIAPSPHTPTMNIFRSRKFIAENQHTLH